MKRSDTNLAMPLDAAVDRSRPLFELPETLALYREHRGFVWRALRHLGVPPADLDDALQEVFIVVHRRRLEFEGNSSIKTWLYAISKMVYLSQRKRMAVRRETLVAEIPDGAGTDDPASNVERQRQFDAVRAVVERLPEDEREVFVLFEVQGMSMHEVADMLGCPLKTAYGRLYRARERFREEFRQSKEAL